GGLSPWNSGDWMISTPRLMSLSTSASGVARKSWSAPARWQAVCNQIPSWCTASLRPALSNCFLHRPQTGSGTGLPSCMSPLSFHRDPREHAMILTQSERTSPHRLPPSHAASMVEMLDATRTMAPPRALPRRLCQQRQTCLQGLYYLGHLTLGTIGYEIYFSIPFALD